MASKQAYIRLAIGKLRRFGRHLLYKRWVRRTVCFLRQYSLPGSHGAPLYDVFRYFFTGIFDGSIAQRAKGLAYSFLVALPPLLIFFFTLVAYFPVDGVQDEVLAEMGNIVPEKIMTPLSDTVNDVMGHRHSTLLSIGFIVSVFFAANGMLGVIGSFVNSKAEKRPFVQRYLLSVLMVFVLYVLIVLTVCLMLGHKLLLRFIFSQGWLANTAANTLMFNIGRWVLLSLASLFAVSFIYYWIPVKRQRLGFFSPGALMATGMFFVLNWGLTVYLNNFSRYNLIYGSIGTLLMLMLWMYFNCFVLLLGYELNISAIEGRITGENRRSGRLLRQRREQSLERLRQTGRQIEEAGRQLSQGLQKSIGLSEQKDKTKQVKKKKKHTS